MMGRLGIATRSQMDTLENMSTYVRSVQTYSTGVVFRDMDGNIASVIPLLKVPTDISLTEESHKIKDLLPGNYKNISVLVVTNFETTDMSDAFEDMENLNVDMSNYTFKSMDFSKMTDISGMFRGVTNTSNETFEFDISSITRPAGLYNIFLGSNFKTCSFTHVNESVISALNPWNLYPLTISIYIKEGDEFTGNNLEVIHTVTMPDALKPLHGNAKEVIQGFMHCLEYCNNNTVSALDTAICVASNNRWHRFSQAKEQFLKDCNTRDNLLRNTNIDLTNEDTGSIIGLDAGVGESKNAEDIVPEAGDIIQEIPSSITKVGLTLTLPGFPTDNQKNIIRALNSWWLESGLSLIKEGYGISFEDEGVRFNDMILSFENDPSSGTLAYVSCMDVNGNVLADGLRKMVINEAFFSDYDGLDKDGKPANSDSKFYLDRIIAHELVHGVMGACQPSFGALPMFLKEGLAELIHGIDDMRISSFNMLLARSDLVDLLDKYLDVDLKYASYLSPSDSRYTNQEWFYTIGYIFLRWLAKTGTTA